MNNQLISTEFIKDIRGICCNKPGLKLTVGLYCNGKEEYHLFENNGNEIPYNSFRYEIGSITKTFTGYILGKAVAEEKVSLDDRINLFIKNLPNNKIYPTLRSLATHTSGYPGDSPEFEKRLEENLEYNEFNNFNYEKVIHIINNITLEDHIYPAVYSNLGIGILGYCMSQVYNKPISQLINEYIDSLNMNDTGITCRNNIDNLINGFKDGKNLGNLTWEENCIVGASGFLYSTAEDVLKYAKSQFDNKNEVINICHTKHAEFSRGEGLPMDIGLCWFLLPDLNIIWHNGETRCFSSLLSLDKKKKVVIVILSNYVIEEITNIGIVQVAKM